MDCLNWWFNWVQKKVRPFIKCWKCQIIPISFILISLILMYIGYIGTWAHLGTIAELLVAIIALGGYGLTYYTFKKREDHQYKPTLIMEFIRKDQPDSKVAEDIRIPGLTIRSVAPSSLDCNFNITNISDTPATEITMNIYLHRESESTKVNLFFERDVLIKDGLIGNSTSLFKKALHFYRLNGVRPYGDQNNLLYFEKLLETAVPRPIYGTNLSRTIYDWSLVLSYKNNQGTKYFSVYKLENTEIGEGLDLRFYGSYQGTYTEDRPGSHEFIRYRGFPTKENSIDWSKVS